MTQGVAAANNHTHAGTQKEEKAHSALPRHSMFLPVLLIHYRHGSYETGNVLCSCEAPCTQEALPSCMLCSFRLWSRTRATLWLHTRRPCSTMAPPAGHGSDDADVVVVGATAVPECPAAGCPQPVPMTPAPPQCHPGVAQELLRVQRTHHVRAACRHWSPLC